MSSRIVTVTVSACGEIRISDGTGGVRTFANATYLAEEAARVLANQADWQSKEGKVRAELARAEKVDGTTVDLIANVRKILDEGIPF